MSSVRRLAVGQWPLRWIIEALDDGSASPEVQKRAAELLASSFGQNGEIKRIAVRGRGRPKHTMRSIANIQLVDFVDLAEEAYSKEGSDTPHQDAIREVAELHEKKPIETIERYFRKGVRESAERDAKIANWIDERLSIEFTFLASNESMPNVTQLKKTALRNSLALAAKRFFGTPFIMEKVYKRGQRARARGPFKPEK